MKYFFILVITVLPICCYAQSDNSFLSRLYFPFDFGFTLLTEKNIKSGSQIKTGIEYRIKKNIGLFARFNFNNRMNSFDIQKNQTTNVINGKLKFNDYSIGLGYRLGNKKIKVFSLWQVGISTYDFPLVTGTPNNFSIVERRGETPIIQMTFGLEYYLAKNAALTVETVYIMHTDNSTFWNNQFGTFGISIGLTTTLF
jgi:hypothetical protein